MMITVVRAAKCVVRYSHHAAKRIQGSKLRLANYRQQDVHSCGFVAALTVVRYFRPDVRAEEVLRTVRPLLNWGVDRHKLRHALAQLGVAVKFRKDLTVPELRKCVKRGTPVIISVWPDEWLNDHWTVVQGFAEDRVYLTNYKSLPVKALRSEWSDMDMRGRGGSGEGFVCWAGE
jgi:ABC-type bacteriocin/lantibiotic exporter with double-glycine peptidase domain